MPNKFLFVSDTNPNDTTGGGGCICDPTKQIDCKGPFAVFPGNDMESIASPHVVVCLECAKYTVEKLENESNVLSAGERSAPAEPELPAPRSTIVTERGIDHEDAVDI